MCPFIRFSVSFYCPPSKILLAAINIQLIFAKRQSRSKAPFRFRTRAFLKILSQVLLQIKMEFIFFQHQEYIRKRWLSQRVRSSIIFDVRPYASYPSKWQVIRSMLTFSTFELFLIKWLLFIRNWQPNKRNRTQHTHLLFEKWPCWRRIARWPAGTIQLAWNPVGNCKIKVDQNPNSDSFPTGKIWIRHEIQFIVQVEVPQQVHQYNSQIWWHNSGHDHGPSTCRHLQTIWDPSEL